MSPFHLRPYRNEDEDAAIHAAELQLPDAWLQEPPFARDVLLSRLQKYADSVRAS